MSYDYEDVDRPGNRYPERRETERLQSENIQPRSALEPFAIIGRKLIEAGEASWPLDASASRLALDGVRVRHFRDAAEVLKSES